jgi:NCS1 family nucleobase:cation symporter-1
VKVADLYTMSPKGAYWYRNGYNRKAIGALVPAAVIPMLCVLVPAWRGAANYTWFIGMALGLVLHVVLSRKR